MSRTQRTPATVLSSSKIAGSAYNYYSMTVENQRGTDQRTAGKMRRLFASALLSTASAVVIASLSGTPARADTIGGGGACVPLTPQNGDTVTCAGTFDETLSFSEVEDLTVVLQAGATVRPFFEDAEGIVVRAENEEYGNGTVKNYGLIITGDEISEGADGIDVRTIYDATVVNGASGFVTTYGAGSDGIVADAYYGDASVTNAGTVGTNGENAYGLVAYSYWGYAYAGNSGTVSTDGDYSGAVYAAGDEGATAVNTGRVSTDGEASYGVVANAYEGNAKATNDGVIEIFGSESSALTAHSGEGNATVRNYADGEITGAEGFDVDGGWAWSDEGNATASNAGDIVLYGDNSSGLIAVAGEGLATATNSGSIDIYGETEGISFEDAMAGLISSDPTEVVDYLSVGLIAVGDSASATNYEGGSIFATGQDAGGMLVIATSPEGTASGRNDGSISTGQAVYEPYATPGYHDAAVGMLVIADDGGATVYNGGDIETYGVGSMGAVAGARGDATATNSGTISTGTVQGEAYSAGEESRTSPGLVALSTAADATATNLAYGVIETSGDNSSGMVALAPEGTAAAHNYGRVTVNGEVDGIAAEELVGILTGAGEPYVSEETAAKYLVTGVVAIGDRASVWNHEGATVTATGQDASGMLAVATSTEYAALAHNDGTIYAGLTEGYHDAAFGMAAIGGEGGAAVNNTGDIQTGGLLGFGALAASDGNAVGYNSGTITTGSEEMAGDTLGGFGIAAASVSGKAYIGNSGDIETFGPAGLGAVAIAGGTPDGLGEPEAPFWVMAKYLPEIVAEYGTALVLNDTEASIVTHGDFGIGAAAVGFLAGVENRGEIRTDGLASVGAASLGLYASVHNAEGGTITTGAADGDDIGAVGMLAGGLRLGAAENDGTVTTYDTGGVGVAAIGAKYAVAQNGYDGSITTHGDYSLGMVSASLFAAAAYNDGEISTGGDVSMGVAAVGSLYAVLDELDPDITSGILDGVEDYLEGLDAPGEFGEASGTLAANGEGGTVDTEGDLSVGVMALNFDNEARAGNIGHVTTSGEYAAGVAAFSVGEDAYAYNNGSIETSGDYSAGLMASGGAQPVWTLFHATGLGSYDLEAVFPDLEPEDMEGDAVAVNYEDGAISTTGYSATGVEAWTTNGYAAAVNLGTVTTGSEIVPLTPSYDGADSAGLWAFSWGDDVLSTAYALNAGTVTTWGDDAAGMRVGAVQEGVDITGSGAMEGAVDGAIIVARAENAGDIVTHGDGSDGIAAEANGDVRYYDYVEYEIVHLDAGASVDNSGSITTYGDYSNGVSAQGPHVEVVNEADATITVNGDYSVGIEARSFGLATTEVENAGTITVNGDYSAGIYATGEYVTIENGATGVIDASDSYAGVIPGDEYGLGILVNDSRDITIDNAGKIYGTVAVGHALGFHIDAMFYNDTDLTNTGTIEGNVILASGDDTVLNEGGTVSGGIYTGRGDDEVTISGTGNEIGYGIHSAADEYDYSTLTFEQTDKLTLDNGAAHSIFEGPGGLSPEGANGLAISGFDRIDFKDGTTVFDETDILTNKYAGDIVLHQGAKVSALDDMWIGAGSFQVGTGSGEGIDTYADLELTHGAAVYSTADFDFANGGRLIVGINGDDDTGFISTTGSMTVAGPTLDGETVVEPGFTVYANVIAGIDLTVGHDLDIGYAEEGVYLTGDAAPTAVDNSILFNFTSGANEHDFYLTVGREQTINDIIDDGGDGTPNKDSISSALEGYLANVPKDNPIVVYLSGNWPNDPEAQAAALRKLVEETVPEEAALSGQSLVAATDAVLDLIMDRLSGGGFQTASSESGVSGVSAGDMPLGGDGNWALWGRAGKNWATFTPSGANGFDADSWGVSGGIDGELADNLRVGVSYFYTKADFDENGAGANSNADIDGNGVVVYATYRPAPWYLNASLGYGWNSYKSKRFVTGFGTNEANYDGKQIMGRAELGYILSEGALDITPHVGLRVNLLDIDGYTETGPAPAVTVDSRDVNSVRGVLGLGLRYTADLGNAGKIVPEGYVRLLNEFGSPDEAITGNIVSGGAFSTKTVARDDLSYALGAGLTYAMNDSVSLRVHYNGEFQSDYDEHAVSASFRFAF
ncbi:hypothetical protein FHS78_000992 [Parvibaculum indicum]|uniref:autotransporter outer membrane beta-barrel domain-containing protein n=1 Tax=Parvibaculum indicum TaxID=562969 RepID=UPI001422D279|nr:autotransporter outer membrane beta-barrel domain-containing protein [Parvibaculum indicum]NIJ40716.1 hypothetical protein [Parvibaculum indicum]